jgi:hypothetical protein
MFTAIAQILAGILVAMLAVVTLGVLLLVVAIIQERTRAPPG